MKVKKIWIAQHPKDKDVFDVSFRDRSGESIHLTSYEAALGERYVEYKEYVILEVEE